MSWQVNPLTAWQWHSRTNRWIPVSLQLHSTWNIKSAINKVTHSKTFLSHNVILHSSSLITLKFTFNKTLLSRFPHPVSSPWTEHSTNRKKPLYKGLWGSCCQQINSQNWELAVCFWTTVKPEFQRLVSNHQTGLNICNVLICWLSLSLWLTWMHLLAGSYQVTYQVQLHPSLVVLK